MKLNYDSYIDLVCLLLETTKCFIYAKSHSGSLYMWTLTRSFMLLPMNVQAMSSSLLWNSISLRKRLCSWIGLRNRFDLIAAWMKSTLRCTCDAKNLLRSSKFWKLTMNTFRRNTRTPRRYRFVRSRRCAVHLPTIGLASYGATARYVILSHFSSFLQPSTVRNVLHSISK